MRGPQKPEKLTLSKNQARNVMVKLLTFVDWGQIRSIFKDRQHQKIIFFSNLICCLNILYFSDYKAAIIIFFAPKALDLCLIKLTSEALHIGSWFGIFCKINSILLIEIEKRCCFWLSEQPTWQPYIIYFTTPEVTEKWLIKLSVNGLQACLKLMNLNVNLSSATFTRFSNNLK